MTADRADVVLVSFVFADESGVKLRPALVLSGPAYHRSRQEVVVAAITSNVQRRGYGDHLVRDFRAAGLLFPSLVTGVLRTVKRSMIARRLGRLPAPDLREVERHLRRALGL